MSSRGGELVATDEPAFVPETLPDAIVVEYSKGNGRFPNSPWTDESDWSEAFSETDDLFDQLATSKAGPWRWGRWLPKYANGNVRCWIRWGRSCRPRLDLGNCKHLPGVNGSNVTRAYRANLTANLSPYLRYIMTNVGNSHMDVHDQLGLKGNR